MSDDFEDHLKRWMRARAGTDRSGLQALAGNVAALPPRRNRLRSNLAAAAAVVLAVGLSAVLLAPRIGTGDQPASPRAASSDPSVLADPAAFPAPERLLPCGGLTPEVQYAFEIRSASDLPRHFPSMTQSIEQLVDVPAIVVVYRGYNAYGVGGSPGSLFTRPPLGPNEHDICVILALPAASAAPLYFDAVDIAGFRVQPYDAASAQPSPRDSIARTSEPTPAWTSDARAALDCDGPPSSFGANGPPGETTESGTPELALDRYLRGTQSFGLPVPIEGFAERQTLTKAVLFAYDVGGRTRAAIVVSRLPNLVATPWIVSSVASCDPSEFDPATPLGVRITIWTDEAGNRVPTTILREQADCYDGTQLTVRGRLFVWDPNNGEFGAYDPGTLEGTFEDVSGIPGTAVDTGFRDGRRQLFLRADGRAALVASGRIVQRWPHVIGDEVSRIDCN
jgi:hypothetical protein